MTEDDEATTNDHEIITDIYKTISDDYNLITDDYEAMTDHYKIVTYHYETTTDSHQQGFQNNDLKNKVRPFLVESMALGLFFKSLIKNKIPPYKGKWKSMCINIEFSNVKL